MAVQVDCSDGILLWPLIYYKKKSSGAKVLHLLFSLFIWYFLSNIYLTLIRSQQADGDSVLRLLYFLFVKSTNTSKNSTTIDILWPLIHFETGPSDFKFQIRPFVWVKSKDDKIRFLTILGIIFYRYHKNGDYYLHILPVFWKSRKGVERFWCIFPIFAVLEKATTISYFIAPCIFYKKPNTDGGASDWYKLIVFPFLWKGRSEAGTEHFILFPVLWKWSNEKDNTSTLCFLLFYKHRKDADVARILFPFIWYFSDTKTQHYRLLIIPLLYYSKQQDSTKLFIVFIYRQKSSDVYRLYILPIIFYARYSEEDYRLNLIPFIYYHKYKENDFYIFIFPLLYYRRISPTEYKYLFLILRVENSPSHLRILVIPLVWYLKDNQDYILVVVPLLYSSKSGNESTFVMFPIVWKWASSPTKYTLWVLPFFYRKQLSQTESTLVLVPLLYRYKKSDTHYRILLTCPPLWISRSDSGSSHTYVFPFYKRKVTREFKETGIFFPLFFTRTWPAIHKTKTYILWPLGYSCTTPEWSHKRFLPIFWTATSNSVTLPTKDNYGFCLLYFWSHSHEHQNATVLPVSGPMGESPAPGPSLHAQAEKHLSLDNIELPDEDFGPTHQKAHQAPQFTAPAFQKESHMRGLIPLGYVQYNNVGLLRIVIVPLLFYFFRKVASTQHNYNMNINNNDNLPQAKSLHTVFFTPLFYRTQTETHFQQWLFPLFYQFNSEAFERIWCWIYIFKHDKVNQNLFKLIIPVYLKLGHGPKTFLFIAPLFYRKTNTELLTKFTCFFPFYWHQVNESKGTSFIYIFPVYGKATYGPGFRKFLVLFPLLSIQINDQLDETVVDFLYPLGHSKRSSNTKVFRFLPFYWHSFKDNKDFLVVFPFIWWFHLNKAPPISNTPMGPSEVVDQTEKRGHMYTVILPLFYRHKQISDGKDLIFFPPCTTYYKQNNSVSFTIWPLFSRILHNTESLPSQYEFMNRTSFVSIHRNPEYERFWIWLLYYKLKASNGDTMSLVVWLEAAILHLFHHQTKAADSSLYHYIVVLYYLSKKNDTKQFSLLWFFLPQFALFFRKHSVDAQGQSTHTTFLVPLVYNMTSPSMDRFAVLWLFHPIASVFYSSTRKDPNSTLKTSWLLLIFWKQVVYGVDNVFQKSYFCVIWIVPKWVCLYKSYQKVSSNLNRKWLFPLFYWEKSLNDTSQELISMFWLFHPIISIFHSNTDKGQNGTKTLSWLLLVYWKQTSYGVDNTFEQSYLCVLWLIPKWVCFFKSYQEVSSNINRMWLFPVFYSESNLNDDNHKQFSLLWLFHPYCSLYHSHSSKVSGDLRTCTWVFPLYWNFSQRSITDFEAVVKQKTCVLWLVPKKVTIFKFYKKNNITRRFIFPLYYHQVEEDIAEGTHVLFSLFWLFHPVAAVYHSDVTKDRVRRFMVLLFWYYKASNKLYFNVLWLFPKVITAFKYERTPDYTRTFLFLVFYRETSSQMKLFALCWLYHPLVSAFYTRTSTDSANPDDLRYLFILYWFKKTTSDTYLCLLWIVPRFVTLFKYHKTSTKVFHWLFLVYHRSVSDTKKKFSLMWIGNSRCALFYTKSKPDYTKTYIAPLWWSEKTSTDHRWCILYIYPPKFALISKDESLVVYMISYSQKNEDTNAMESYYLYFFYYRACLIHTASGPGFFKFWIAFLLWWETNTEARNREETQSAFAMFWIYKPKFALISKVQNQEQTTTHVILVFWRKTEVDGDKSFGMLWLFHYRISLIAHWELGTEEQIFVLPIYLHFAEKDIQKSKSFILFGIIYTTQQSQVYSFRLLYRWVLVKNGPGVFKFEFNPLFAYSSNHGNTKWSMLGGFIGSKSKNNQSSCKCCWCLSCGV